MVMIRNFCLLQPNDKPQVIYTAARICCATIHPLLKTRNRGFRAYIKGVCKPFGAGNVILAELIIRHDAVRPEDQVLICAGDQPGLHKILFQQSVQLQYRLHVFAFSRKGQVRPADDQVSGIAKADQDGHHDHDDDRFHDRKGAKFSGPYFHC